MKLVLLLALLVAFTAQADIYKCPGPNGQVAFADRPCDGAADSADRRLDIKPPAPSKPLATPEDAAARAAKWEEAQRFYYVDIPAAERQAAELMASSDPKAQTLGREMAWQAQRGREAFEQLRRAHDQRLETDRRYKDALRKISGY